MSEKGESGRSALSELQQTLELLCSGQLRGRLV